MKHIIRILSFLAFCLIPSYLPAQTLGGGAILQGGPWAQGHAPMYVGQGSSQAIVMDSGPASGGGIGVGMSEGLYVARGTGTPPFIGRGSGPFGTNWCDYDAPTTNPTGYHFLCLSANVNGHAYITTGPGGTQPPGGLTFNINGIETTYTGAMPVLFSVGADFNSGLITVTNSPITTSGNLHFNVAGTSGGIPYFDTSNSWNTSGVLGAGLPIVGGGVGVAPSSAAKSGTTNTFATATGAFVDGDCLAVSSGNVIDAGGPCTTGGGGGTVSPSTANNMAYYQLTGTTVTGLPTANNGVLATDGLGAPSISSTLPTAVQGNITTVGIIGTGSWAATPIAGIHGGTGLTSYTSGGLIYASSTTTLASSSALASGLPLVGGGVGAAPTTGTKSGNTNKFVTTTGTLTAGDCASWDASGNAIDSGSGCGGIVFAGTDGGTANAKVVTSASYTLAADHVVVFVATATNTGAATANVNGTGVKNIFISSPGGPVALSGGEIVSGNVVTLTYDGTQYQLAGSSVTQSSGVAMSTGLQIKNNSGTPNTQIDVSANAVQMLATSGAAITKFSVAQTINAATNGANGLDTGSLAASTWYYVWEISNGSTTAGLLSLSSTAPTLPAGYGYKARVGAFLTDGSSNFLNIIQVGAKAVYENPVLISSSSGTAVVSVSAYVPPTSNIFSGLITTTGSTSSVEMQNALSNSVAKFYAGGTSGVLNNSAYGDILLSPPFFRSIQYTITGLARIEAFGWIDNIVAF